MATNNPYKKPDDEKGGLTPVIPGLQPQYDQPLRRPSSSSMSSTSHKEDPATTTKPTTSETEQPQPMPLNTQPFPTNSHTPLQQQPPMPLNTQPVPSEQYTPPAPQQLPVQTNTQQQPLPRQQTNIGPPPSQPAPTQQSLSQPVLLTQQHTPSEQEQQPPSYASSQQQESQPPPITAMHEKDLSASPELSSTAQKMNKKVHDRYHLKEEPQTQTFSPRQEHAQRYQDVSAEHLVENPVGDPTLDKLKSGFWKGAGKVQAALGDLSGLEQWQDQGRTNEAWADTAYREAESRQRLGEASWLNGEYNVIMGKLTNALGYVAGNPEMQAKARLRAHEGQQEIERLKR